MINILNELSSVLNISDFANYKNKNPLLPNDSVTGWFPLTKNTKITYTFNITFGRYYCVEIKYPNQDELKFIFYKNKIKMQVRKGFINLFKFEKVQHCEFTPNLTGDMYHQYMFIEDHWEITPQEYKVLNTIYNRMEQYISEEPL